MCVGIHELEHIIGRPDVQDNDIESLRKDVEDALDHIDDELFANLVSRVSYLKMRREWGVCVYVCVCFYVCMYVHTNIHPYTHTHTYIHTFIHSYIHTYIRKYIRTYIHTYLQ